MSRKSILNLTSRKKRNGMLTWNNTTGTGATAPVNQSSLIVNAATQYRGIWCATAQDLTSPQSTLAFVGAEATRTATTCYMRGLSEHVRIQTSSGLPWFWRRVCFTLKGSDLTTFSASDTPTQVGNRYVDTTNGIQRLFFNEVINSQPNTLNDQDSIIFKGAKGVDWTDAIIAPIDTRRLTVKFDKTWTLRSGNANGVVTERKLWHGMNKNLVYSDDESGGNEATSYFSVDSKAGMGDYYVMDIISPGTGGGTGDLLQLSASSTLYWHEK